ncbi:MAG TPA: hypothetical protein VF395_14730, partial [Polyangiaceae bacterium]
MAMLSVPVLDTSPVSLGRTLRLFAPHLLALAFPLNALAFVLSGPHPALVAVLFTVPVFGSTVLDRRSGEHAEQPLGNVPSWPF